LIDDLQLSLVADLSPHLAGPIPVSLSAGPAQEAVCLAVHEADREALFAQHSQPGWATFPKPRAEHRYEASVLVHDGRNVRRTAIEDDTSFPHVQPMPNGEILLVGARCQRLPDGSAQLNARVYGPDGQLRHEFCLGDGIEDVQATLDGNVWVSYFDEGIYGNFGWGGPDGQEPLGAAGLVRFDAEGREEWQYRPPDGVGAIDDCYALNVADGMTWAYYYSNFPLVRIDPAGNVDVWRTDVHGARAFAICEDQVLFYGGYKEERQRCTLWRIGDGEVMDPRELRLIVPSGDRFQGTRLVGRGSILHAFDGPIWYQRDLRV